MIDQIETEDALLFRAWGEWRALNLHTADKRAPFPAEWVDFIRVPKFYMLYIPMGGGQCRIDRQGREPHTLHRCAEHNVYVIWG